MLTYSTYVHAIVGVIHGRGRYTYVDGAYYEGSFDMGAKSGYGVHAFVSGARYLEYAYIHTYILLVSAFIGMRGCGRIA